MRLLDADHEELRVQLAASFSANGWDEPGMEAYDAYPAAIDGEVASASDE
jgi:hypothetical protein